MKILVTGGSGVIGAGLIPELLSRGHEVRLLSRHAGDDVRQWHGVEPLAADVADAVSLRGACAGCEAVIHVAGIASEKPPELTFERVNVEGTRNVVDEALRSSVRRLLFVSSLGADRGASPYHQSKRAAEKIVAGSELDWTIVRPGNVYGPGDEVISNILKMVRVLPAVPVIDDGNQPFQPIWFEDVGKAIATILERKDLHRDTIELAGPDVTTLNDLLRKLGAITDRKPLKIPVPMPLATVATKLTSMAIDLPIDETRLTMLREKNVLSDPDSSPLRDLGVEATPLDAGLRKLADILPEQLPEDGVGKMEHKRFWSDIEGSRHAPAALMHEFRARVTEIMPIEFAAEPGAPTRVELGATLTGSLPLRGNFQVRVEVSDPTRVVFATVEGHPLAGIVEFTTKETRTGLRFAIDVYTRAANPFDLLASRTVGAPAQSANWRTVVQRMIDISGGTSDGVHEEVQKLEEEQAARMEKEIRALVEKRQRMESALPENAR
jgi:uncharacterized protein YbjT (DUF2867 family)